MRGRQRRTALGLAMVVVMIAAIVVGCFAGSGSRAAIQNEDEVGTPVDWKPEPSLSGGLQRFASYEDLKDFLKTAPSYPGYWYYSDDRGNVVFSLGFGDAKASSEEGSSDYSRTNIQVEGVDEADIVKSDGEYIYLAIDNRLVIARAYPPEEARVLCELELEGNIEGLFINGDRLAVLEGSGTSVRHLASEPYRY